MPPPRLPVGRKFIGPDYYGCSNTGLAPTILHSRWLHLHPLSNRGFRFVIGPDVHLQEAAQLLTTGKVPAGQNFVEFGGGQRRVTFARTYSVAKTRFAFLVKELLAENAKTQASQRRTLAKARSGDAQARLDLLDF